MSIEMIKGTEEYFDECVSALRDSTLGLRYFSTEGSAEYAIHEGLKMDTLYVAIENEQFKGFMYYIPNGAFHSFPYLHLLVTKPSARGTGVGSQMLKHFEQITDKPKLFLVVSDFNPDGKRFYEKNGYVQVGCMENLYRPGITENLMMKEVK